MAYLMEAQDVRDRVIGGANCPIDITIAARLFSREVAGLIQDQNHHLLGKGPSSSKHLGLFCLVWRAG